MRQPVPLRKRRLDLLFLVFLVINLGLVTYIIDLEQVVIADPANFDYPGWPPAPMIDLVHWYGRSFDPLLMARPPFWQMTIWIDLIFFGPFYAAAIYAFIRGRDWIRVPALVWSGTMMANVLIILMEEKYGVHATPKFPMVLMANLAWLLLPLAMIARMIKDHPFTEPAVAPGWSGSGTTPGLSVSGTTR
jgi:hypothetical protein